MTTGRTITVGGKAFPSLAAAARAFDLNTLSLRWRIKAGWSTDEAFELAPRVAPRSRPITLAGVTYDTLADASRAHGADYHAVRHRLSSGADVAVAFSLEGASKSAIAGRVYSIVHKATGKTYVGRTTSKVNTRWRWHVHKALSAKNVHPLSLQAAIRQFGEHAFEVSEIATATSFAELMLMEARYIRELATMAPGGFNLSPGDTGRTVRGWSAPFGGSNDQRAPAQGAASAVGAQIALVEVQLDALNRLSGRLKALLRSCVEGDVSETAALAELGELLERPGSF